jgi:hypothetical protein
VAGLVLFGASPAAALVCKDLEVDGHKFDFSKLTGPHTVTTSEYHPPTFANTTYTLDICSFLKRKGEVGKDNGCPEKTRGKDRICARSPHEGVHV